MNNELSTTNSFDLAKPTQALEVARILQEFVKKNKLTVTVQGKEYPLVECWTFCGSQFGLIPIVKTLECLSSANSISGDAEIKYRAEVEVIRVIDGSIVGRGIAICSNREGSKRRFDEYAIASMAQTRATGKAFRIPLGWLMKASGLEATPAEEMDFRKDEPTEDEKNILRKLVHNTTLEEDKRQEAFAMIDGCRDYTLYQKLQYRLESLQIPIDQVINPSATDIKNHVRKVSKQPAA